MNKRALPQLSVSSIGYERQQVPVNSSGEIIKRPEAPIAIAGISSYNL